MTRLVITSGLIVALITLAAPVASAEEHPSSKAPPKASGPVISLKANIGGQNMEVEVGQTDDGMEVSGTINDQTVSAKGDRQPDGTVRVEVTKDEGTIVEMTINPDALRQQAGSPTQKQP